MSNVFIPLGGTGGKNRGTAAVLGDDTPFINSGSEMSLPLPAGVYKKSKSNPRADYGDGKNAEVTISVGLLRKMVLKVFGIASIKNLQLTAIENQKIRVTWAKPDRGLWNGVHLVFKYDSMPTGIDDGFMFKDSADVYFDTDKLEEKEVYVRAFNYLTVANGRWYDDGEISTHVKVKAVSGSITLSAGAGVWTVPEGVKRIRYILVGHGGIGGTIGSPGAGGGGGGGYFKQGYMNVTPGQGINYIIPSTVKAGYTYNHQADRAEYHTVFGSDRVAYGRNAASGASDMSDSKGGNGGSGGGGPCLGAWGNGSPGGSDGSDGIFGAQTNASKPASYASGGTGQHSSTRGFNGVLYCGGGGGGNATGGAGGGGNGGNSRGNNGTDGLGGGGGGSANYSNPGTGGTGCIYIAWGSLMNDGT